MPQESETGASGFRTTGVEFEPEHLAAEQLLKEKEEQYRRIFDATSDGLIINDPSTGCVVGANPAVSRMHGYTQDEFIGLHATEFIHPDYHSVFADFLETIIAGGTYQTQAIDTRKDGSNFPVEVNGSSVTYQGRPHILAVVRDVTERVRAFELLEERVAERTRELAMLLEVARNVTSTLELGPVLSMILDQIKTVVDYADASIISVENGLVRIIGNRGPLPADLLVNLQIPLQPDGPTWRVVETQRSVIVPDVEENTPDARSLREVVAPLNSLVGARCWMAVPMMLGQQVVGILTLSHREPGFYTDRHAALVRAIAQQASIAIENARLYSEAQEMAALEERQRLARELHDSVSQALYSIVLGIKTARSLLDTDPERAAEPMEFALAQAETGLAEMRALIFELRPEALETEGLVVAIEKQADFARARHRLKVHTLLGQEPELQFSAKEALYRITQEALHNIVKHAHATVVHIRLGSSQTGAEIEIRDDGCGFDPGAEYPGHLGLQTMRERAAKLGGEFAVESASTGTVIRARVPVIATHQPVTTKL